MKKIAYVILLLSTVMVSCRLSSQHQEETELYLIIEDGLWGYLDASGNIAIEPQFYSAGEFSQGLAAVRKKGTYGCLNKNGAFVIPPQFEKIPVLLPDL
ncbi:MAG: WG repeat-containing protein [Bacteroidota bacterium]